MSFGNGFKSLDAADSAVDRVARETAFLKRFVAESDRFFLTRDDRKRVAVGSVDHCELNGVRADVDCCEFQLEAL